MMLQERDAAMDPSPGEEERWGQMSHPYWRNGPQSLTCQLYGPQSCLARRRRYQSVDMSDEDRLRNVVVERLWNGY